VKVGLLVTLLALLASTAVRAEDRVAADCPERPTSADDARQVAGEWFAKGQTAVKDEDWKGALGAFLCSFRIVPHPAGLFNAAQAARSLGDVPVTRDLLERFLAQAPDSNLAPRAREQLAELGPAPEPEPEIEPEPEPETEPEPEPEAEPGPEPIPEPEAESGPNLSVLGYVGLGLGGAGLVAGAVLQGMAGAAQGRGEETSDYGTFSDEQDRMEGLQTGAIVAFVAGGVLAGTGIALILVDRNRDGDEPVSVSLRPLPGGLALGGTFQ
jgi:hypothetical protein